MTSQSYHIKRLWFLKVSQHEHTANRPTEGRCCLQQLAGWSGRPITYNL